MTRRTMTGVGAKRRRDRGVVLPFMAITLVALLALAALAVDLGALYNHRRQQQSAVDAAALSGMLEYAQDLQFTDQEQIFDAVVDLSYRDLWAPQFSLTEWEQMWRDCPTATAQADGYSVASTDSECIWFDQWPMPTRMRVALPTVDMDTTFARLVGVETWSSTAAAEVGLNYEIDVGGGVLPFGLDASAGTGLLCLKSGSGGSATLPCVGSDSGNFGYLAFTNHNTDQPHNEACNQTGRIVGIIAAAVDHGLSTLDGEPHLGNVVSDNATCQAPGGPHLPNSVETETGNMANMLGQGLFAGANVGWDGGPARLQRISSRLPDTRTVTLNGGYVIDDNPIWAFLEPEGDDYPDSCNPDQFPGTHGPNAWSDHKGTLPNALVQELENPDLHPDIFGNKTPPAHVTAWVTAMTATRELVMRCFTHYEGGTYTVGGWTEPPSGCAAAPCTSPIFAKKSVDGPLWDIERTSRFGYVPRLTGDFPPGSSQLVHFAGFQPVYIQVFCRANNCGHPRWHEPGFGHTTNTNDLRANDLVMFSFHPNMLPGQLGTEPNPADRDPIDEQPVALIR